MNPTDLAPAHLSKDNGAFTPTKNLLLALASQELVKDVVTYCRTQDEETRTMLLISCDKDNVSLASLLVCHEGGSLVLDAIKELPSNHRMAVLASPTLIDKNTAAQIARYSDDERRTTLLDVLDELQMWQREKLFFDGNAPSPLTETLLYGATPSQALRVVHMVQALPLKQQIAVMTNAADHFAPHGITTEINLIWKAHGATITPNAKESPIRRSMALAM